MRSWAGRCRLPALRWLQCECQPATEERLPVHLLQLPVSPSSALFILESLTSIYYLKKVNIYLNEYSLYVHINRFFMIFKYLLPSFRHFLGKVRANCALRVWRGKHLCAEAPVQIPPAG